MAKKKKREREQQRAAVEAGAVHQAKRMRLLDPLSVPNDLILFDWEMAPTQMRNPPVTRRVSGITGTMMSSLMDSFGDATLLEGSENPFEPTPLYLPSQTRMHEALSIVKEEAPVVLFDPKSLMADDSQFRRRNSIFLSDDISAMSACEMRFDESFRFQHYQETRQAVRELEGESRGPKISTAFAA